MYQIIPYVPKPSWNKGKLVGQKRPLKLEEIWSKYLNHLRKVHLAQLKASCNEV